MPLIQGINLAKSYDQGLNYLFCEVNFAIDEGKHIALLGANGSGKSTLVRIIAGLTDVEGLLQIKRGLTISYQDQDLTTGAQLVREVLMTPFAWLCELQQRITALEAQLSESGASASQRIR